MNEAPAESSAKYWGSGKKGGLMENWYIGLDLTEFRYRLLGPVTDMSIVIKWKYGPGHIGLPVPPDIAIDRYVQTDMSIAIKMDISVVGISEPISPFI